MPPKACMLPHDDMATPKTKQAASAAMAARNLRNFMSVLISVETYCLNKYVFRHKKVYGGATYSST